MASENLDIIIRADGDKARREIDKLQKSMGGMKKFAGVAGKAILGLGVATGTAAIAIGTKAVMASAKFEGRMGDLATLVGANTDALDTMKNGILALTGVIPKDADELGASAYSIVSAGITDAAEALSVLESSGKLAVAGLASTEQATDLLTTAINAFGLDASKSDEVANVLFKTVKAGKTTVADLSQSFGKMAGNAVAAGVSFEDVQAATAALTTVTGKTSEAQNALAQVFLELTQTGGKFSDGLEDVGLNIGDLNKAIQEKGLVAAFEEARDTAGLTDTEFKNLFSSAEGGTAVFQLLTGANDAHKKTLKDLLDPTNALNDAFSAQNDTLNAQWQIVKNNLEKAFIHLGDTMGGPVKDAIKFLNGQFQEGFPIIDTVKNKALELIETFDKQTGIVTFLREAYSDIWEQITTQLVPAWKDLLKASEPYMPLFKSIAQLVGTVVVAAFLILLHVIEFLIKSFIIFETLMAKVQTAIMNAMKFAINPMKEGFDNLRQSLKDMLSDLKSIWDWASKAVGMVKKIFGGGGKKAPSANTSFIGPTMSLPGRAAGGAVMRGKPYKVGEKGTEMFIPGQTGTIVPNDKMENGGAVYNFTFNGDVVDRDILIRQVKDAINHSLAAPMASNAW